MSFPKMIKDVRCKSYEVRGEGYIHDIDVDKTLTSIGL